jgi:predicted Zn-dependent protease
MMTLAGSPWTSADAQSSRPSSLLRDAEIEDTIRLYATPLFQAAGLDPGSIDIYLVNSKEANAFVTTGRRMFIFSGLLMQTNDPNEIIGVIAHETGHIAGGHMLRARGAAETASATAIWGLLLGVAVAAATGDGGAAAAGAAAGLGVATSGYLSFSRTQESSADQAALSYLDATGQSARGLQELFKTFENQELLSAGSQDPYMRTHPLSGERMQAMQHHLEISPYSDAPTPEDLQIRQDRMVAKLVGFLESMRIVQQRYPESDQSIPARYARAIAFYLDKQMDKAVPLVDGLIAEEPDNPYFHELRGQMLFETGSYEPALESYERSVELAPDQPLLRIGYARTLIEIGGTSDLEIAARELETALRTETEDAGAWNSLGIAYGKLGQEARSAMASAEYAYLIGDKERARYLAERALQGLEYGTPDWQRADDILGALNAGGG